MRGAGPRPGAGAVFGSGAESRARGAAGNCLLQGLGPGGGGGGGLVIIL